jgi:NAD(P)-dependent dehydrogenase (short-subunit alcohol dehydrogenase family)
MTAKSWLITGVSSGFGRELTTQLLDRGDIAGFEAQADLAASTDFPGE